MFLHARRRQVFTKKNNADTDHSKDKGDPNGASGWG
jgi:hypothetical protein